MVRGGEKKFGYILLIHNKFSGKLKYFGSIWHNASHPADSKKRRSSFLVAMLFAAADVIAQ